MSKIIFRIALLIICILSAVTLFKRTELSILALGRIDPIPQTRTLIDNNKYAEAAEYLGFFMAYDYVNERPDAKLLYQQIQEKRSHWGYKLGKIGEGLIHGSSDESLGQAAGVATDFFVIGDIRDLGTQAARFMKGDDADAVVVALAALGLAASASQVATGVGTVTTAGAALPGLVGTTAAKSALSVLKKARKLSRLPQWLSQEIVQTGKVFRQTGNFGNLPNIFGVINTLATTRGGIMLLGETMNASDLRRMGKYAEKLGSNSAIVYRIGGKKAVDLAQMDNRFSRESIELAATYGSDGFALLEQLGEPDFKNSVRLAKVFYKGEFFKLAAQMFLKIPSWVHFLVVISSVTVWFPRRWLQFLKERVPGLRRDLPGV